MQRLINPHLFTNSKLKKKTKMVILIVGYVHTQSYTVVHCTAYCMYKLSHPARLYLKLFVFSETISLMAGYGNVLLLLTALAVACRSVGAASDTYGRYDYDRYSKGCVK